jgi:YHS domain-containing protein/thiol-disulfide isomerase/thioredoxin
MALAGTNLPAGALAQAPTGAWLHNYQQAAQLATQQGRPLVVHFHASFCGPCRQMDRDTLSTPEVKRMLRDGFVGVKVDLEQHPEVGQQFGVELMPTDIFLGPDGTEISRSTGNTPKLQYLATMSRIEARFAQARQPKANAVVVAGPRAPTTAAASLPREKTVPEPTDDVEPQHSAEVPRQPAKIAAKIADANANPPGPGLDGYCPVTLRNTRSWKKGRTEFTLDYDDQTYYFQGASELAAFKANPGRYSPKLLGCDPVVLSETELLAPGTTKFGAFFDGELYLFKSSETRARFKNDPLRYSRVRHVLKPGDLQKRRA